MAKVEITVQNIGEMVSSTSVVYGEDPQHGDVKNPGTTN